VDRRLPIERERTAVYLHFFLLVIASHAPNHRQRAGPPIVNVAALVLRPLTAASAGIYASQLGVAATRVHRIVGMPINASRAGSSLHVANL